jgi:predicted permease
MRPLRKLLRVWRRRRRFESDLAEEIRIHREMSGAAAFGSVALTLEESRAVWGLAWLDSWKQDIRYALRGFRRSPGFALGVIGAIGLGIGLNTTVFTIFNTYVLRPFAVRDPYSLYRFSFSTRDGKNHSFTAAEVEDLVRRKSPFVDAAACRGYVMQMDGRASFGEIVSANYFAMLGAGMSEGRPLQPGDPPETMVLSYDAWRNKFGSAAGMIGRKLYLRGHPFEVVGITSPTFAGIEPGPVAFWIPVNAVPMVVDGSPDLRVLGRLAPGVTPEAAQAMLRAWANGITPEARWIFLQSAATMITVGREEIAGFLPIFLSFGLVLAIACANVSNMMLARALSRQREVAIRVSLGAGRGRLIRQLLTESVLLALPAALAGFLIAEATLWGALRLLYATIPSAMARIMAIPEIAPDWHVFLFILASAMITALLFGLVPAIQTTRTRLVEANRGDFSSDYRPARLRSLLVAGQVTVCALLLVVTAVVLRSERRALGGSHGLDTHGVWDLRVLPRYQAQAADRMRRVPGVAAVAAAYRAPLYGGFRRFQYRRGQETLVAAYDFVSAGYFAVFRIPVVRGRLFTDAESDGLLPVAVVSETAARYLWPGRDPIGEELPADMDGRPAGLPRTVRIVGVVRDTAPGFPISMAKACVYLPTNARTGGNESLLVRVEGAPSDARPRLDAALDRIAPSLSDMINPLDDMAALQVYPFRAAFWVTGFLGGVALLLTVSGIYGVLSYAISQRTREIGIRLALGAGPRQVLAMVLRQSAWLVAGGAAVGLGLALIAAPLVANQLDMVQPYDWVAYAGTAAVVLAAALAASSAPARRAVTIDPVRSLRCD